MKKLLVLGWVAVLVLTVMTGCGKSTGEAAEAMNKLLNETSASLEALTEKVAGITTLEELEALEEEGMDVEFGMFDSMLEMLESYGDIDEEEMEKTTADAYEKYYAASDALEYAIDARRDELTAAEADEEEEEEEE